MSESIYSDPAAPERGGVRVSAPGDPTRATASSPGVIAKIIRRWWLVAVCVALAIGASLAYLAAADKVYTSQCVLAAEIERDSAPPGNGVAPDDFLYQQRDLIQSPPVLAAAATSTIKSEANVRDALDVSVSKGEGIVTIAYSAPRADDAARGANAVADAYLRTRTQQQTSSTAGLTELTKQRDQLTAERAKREAAWRELGHSGAATGTDAERAAAARLEQLQQAVTAAEVEATSASAAVAAAKQSIADPQQLRAIVDANHSKGIFDRLESQRTPLEAELAQLEPQLEKQRQSMLPQHPVVIATQRKIDQLKAKLAELDKQYAGVYLAHLEQQRGAAQKRVEELKQLVGEQSAQAKDHIARAAKLAKIEAELKKLDVATAAVDRKIRDVTLAAAAPAAPTLKVVAPAQPPSRPTHPDRDKTILTAAAIGLALGLGLGAIVPARRGR